MRRGRPDKAGSAFLVLWMTFWLAAILIAAWTMGERALSGEPAAAIVLFLWIGAALFGLVSAARALRAAVIGERREPRLRRDHHWNDGFHTDAPATPPPPPDDPEAGHRS